MRFAWKAPLSLAAVLLPATTTNPRTGERARSQRAVSFPSPGELRDYWSSRDNYDDEWNGRAALAAGLIGADETWFCDIGCGPQQALRHHLPVDSTYIPVDLKQWTDEVHACNLNSLELPRDAVLAADVCFLLGVLEYVENISAAIEKLSTISDTLIISYCSTDVSQHRSRLWLNAYSGPQIGSILGLSGYFVERSLAYKPGQYVMRARNRDRIAVDLRAKARHTLAQTG